MIKLIALLKRQPGVSREEFTPRWVEEHTKLSTKIPGVRGYRINISTLRQPEGDVPEPIYDGTAELWFDSIDAMEDAFNTPIGVEAGADADTFTSIRKHLYTEEYIVMPGPEEPKAKPKRKPARKAAKKTAKKAGKKTVRRK